MKKQSELYFQKLHTVLDSLDYRTIDAFVDVLWRAHTKDKTIFFVGNGGSASTATHLAADIGKNTVLRPHDKKEKRFKTFALTDNPAWLLSVGNDIGYEDIFVQQLMNFCRKGDVVVAISGSGNSLNVVKAVRFANDIGAYTVGLVGFNGGKLKSLVRLNVQVPVNHYGYVEGVHSEIHHFVVEELKQRKMNKKNKR